MTEPRIALDTAGGDFAPEATVAGAVAARRGQGVAAVLVGDRAIIEERLRREGERPDRWRIEHAPDAIEMDAPAVAAVRAQPDSSMRRAAELLKAGDADALVTMGNTGAAMAAGVLILGRATGVERPGLAALLPSQTPISPLVIDVGANAEAKALHLAQFALMGQIYQTHVRGVSNPRVGLLSIGEEAAKGNALVLETAERLRAAGLRYAGHVEPGGVFRTDAEVIVCDGFSGNILIKAMESTAEFAFDTLRQEIGARVAAKIGALLMRPAFRGVRRRTDYAQWGGVPLLGVRGVVIIGHGRSNGKAVASALRAADRAVRAALVRTIEDGLTGLDA